MCGAQLRKRGQTPPDNAWRVHATLTPRSSLPRLPRPKEYTTTFSISCSGEDAQETQAPRRASACLAGVLCRSITTERKIRRDDGISSLSPVTANPGVRALPSPSSSFFCKYRQITVLVLRDRQMARTCPARGPLAPGG